MALGVDHDEQPLFDPAYQLIAVFAVTVSSIGAYDAIGVKKRVCRISKIESALTEAGVIFDFVPFKIHALSVVQWPMIGKTVRACACLVYFPCFRFAAALLALPSTVRGPDDFPP